MSKRWRIDPGIAEMIEYFDDPRRKYRWDVLTWKEVAAIENEIKKCRNSFEYAARNYFWITNKNRQDVNFSLWEAQELILEKLNYLKSKGRAQKLMILKARQLGAISPKTKILTADLKWVPIEELTVDDEIVGIDEEPVVGNCRRLVKAQLIDKWATKRESYSIILDNGIKLLVTWDHPFLVRQKHSKSKWITAEHIKPDQELLYIDSSALEDGEWDGLHVPPESPYAEWVKVLDCQPIGEHFMIDIQTTSKTFIAEGIVTHNCSTLIEALIAWRTMFFPNTEALVVSVDRNHAAYLFGIMQHILDRMPWWLKPMEAARKYEEGIWFQNRDEHLRGDYPGLNSRITVQAANQISGIGQGRRINACHISEGADWDQNTHRMTMEGDLQYALVDSPDTFAVWESTAKGAGTYTEQLWLTNVRLGEKAEWYPVFLPWFMEKTRFIPHEQGWRPEPTELRMRERIKEDWVRCNNPDCGVFRENHPIRGMELAGSKCDACGNGTLVNYELSDGQLCWIWRQRINKQAKGEEALKELKAELCSTSQEAFQLSGYLVFPEDCQEWVISTIRSPIIVGDFDSNGNFHGHDPKTGRCYQSWCEMDHRYDSNPLEIWELPNPRAHYVIGVDVAEGLGGKSDYSVAFVNKVTSGDGDYQVAMYRTNTMDPISFAYCVNWLGRWYNEAMLSIEYNGIGASCADTVRYTLQYPNLYRWLRPDSDRPESSKWHWYTQYDTRPKLWQNGRKWLKSKLWVIRSEIFYEEMLHFRKDEYDDKVASAASGWHDDCLMAGLIALYTAHQANADTELLENAAKKGNYDLENDPLAWQMECTKCDNKWLAREPDKQCPKCGSYYIHGRIPTGNQGAIARELIDSIGNMEVEYEEVPEWNAL